MAEYSPIAVAQVVDYWDQAPRQVKELPAPEDVQVGQAFIWCI
jgi:hypothetical protein